MNSIPSVIAEPASSVIPLEPLDPKRLVQTRLMTRSSWFLVAALVACGSFALGARWKKSESSGLPGGLPAGLPGLGGGRGMPDISALTSLLGGGAGGSGAAGAAQLAAASTSSGEIVLVSGGKIYIKMANGTTKAIAISSGTKVLASDATTADALIVGKRVIVDGRAEESGVMAANQIVISP
jgi:hypothetical protein